MILPPFVGAVGVKQMLGVNGAFNAALIKAGLMDAAAPFDWLAQGRFAGIVLMIALNLYPILYMNIAAALSNLDPAMEQAAENLGCPPWKRFFRITLPLAMPGVFAGSSIVFIWAFTELGVPLVFDYGRTASVQIFDGLKGLDKNPIPYALTAVSAGRGGRGVRPVEIRHGPLAAGHRAAPEGPRVRRCGCAVGNPRPARCLFLGVFLLAAIPHLGVLLLSVAGRWYGTVVPDQFTLRHYIEALGNGLVVPIDPKQPALCRLRHLAGAGHRPRRGVGRGALGFENPRLARCRGHAAAGGARAGDGLRLPRAFAGRKTVPFPRRRGWQSVHAAGHRLCHPPAALRRSIRRRRPATEQPGARRSRQIARGHARRARCGAWPSR